MAQTKQIAITAKTSTATSCNTTRRNTQIEPTTTYAGRPQRVQLHISLLQRRGAQGKKAKTQEPTTTEGGSKKDNWTNQKHQIALYVSIRDTIVLTTAGTRHN